MNIIITRMERDSEQRVQAVLFPFDVHEQKDGRRTCYNHFYRAQHRKRYRLRL